MFWRFFTELWIILTAMAPWLFLGALVAGLLKIWLPEGFVARHVGRPSVGSVIKTTLLGVPLPLCSCGVLPAAISLKKDGASDGAAVGFLISTPQTGVDSILVTASFLGWPLALFKVVAALVTGVVGGITTLASDRRPALTAGSEAQSSCPLTPLGRTSRWQGLYHYAINELIGGVYGYLAVGILLAALIGAVLPAESLNQMPFLQGLSGMFITLLIALPLYICSTGSVPIAASLIQAGLPAGSALVFLMAGPATNAATLASVFRTFGRRITLIYLFTVIAGSLLFGWLFQTWLGSQAVSHLFLHHHQWPLWRQILDQSAAAVLVLLIIRWAWLDGQAWWKSRRPAGDALIEEMLLQVSGMSCENCAAHIRREIAVLPGVAGVEVNVLQGWVRVRGTGLERSRLTQAIQQAGYAVCPA